MTKFLVTLIICFCSVSIYAKAIVVLGDSLSAGYGIEVEQSWVFLLQKKINYVNKGYTVYNESISGDTSLGGVARIDNALSKHKPNIVLLELGANDGLRGLSPARMKSNLAEIIKRSQAADAKVLLLGIKIPPNYGKRYTEMFYNVYPQLAKEFNIPLVPFILEDVALNKELMQNDGYHPNHLGQPVIVERVWKYLLPMLE
jgi:acyl-CoA thioesterase I